VNGWYLFLAVATAQVAVYDTLTLLRVALGKGKFASGWMLGFTVITAAAYTTGSVIWFRLVWA
jgi:hypothetical protein